MPTSTEWIGFTVGSESKRSTVALEPERPFRIAVLGDFSGRGVRGEVNETPLAERRANLVDRDNFEDVLGSLKPSLGGGVEIHELDDFHPDRLYERLPLFRALRDLRRRLADPVTFPAAAEEFLGGSQSKPVPAAPVSSGKDLLDQILGVEIPIRTDAPEEDFKKYLRDIVSPHLVPGEDPRQAELLAQIDKAATQEMRSLLSSPVFQAVESLWRSLFLLVRSLETGSDLQVLAIDISRDEIRRDLLAEDKNLEATGLYKLLVEETGDWSVLVDTYTFGPDMDDLITLGRAAALAKAAKAPWISTASSMLVGCSSFASHPDPDDWDKREAGAWQALRELPETSFVGLASPRFLLRLPYGKSSDPCERFAFEEIEDAAKQHEGYLWGPPAIACALLLGQAFETDGWEMRPGTVSEIQGLPQHVYRQDGESVSKPCAEVALTERAADRMLETGIMPLASIRFSDRVRLVRMQSIAGRGTALSGKWLAAK